MEQSWRRAVGFRKGGPGAPDRNPPVPLRRTSTSCCAAAGQAQDRAARRGFRRSRLCADRVAVLALWGFSGFFRVEPDELGVVLRFGKYVRDVQPGLNYHLPYPIESALTPKALRVNKIDVGMRLVEDIRRGTTMREAPEESLMLTS